MAWRRPTPRRMLGNCFGCWYLHPVLQRAEEVVHPTVADEQNRKGIQMVAGIFLDFFNTLILISLILNLPYIVLYIDFIV